MNLDSNWKILYTGTAREDFKNFPKDVQKRIARKMRFFVSIADLLKFAKPIKDKSLGDFRFRIGDYRVAFSIIAKRTIVVTRIAKRDEIYK